MDAQTMERADYELRFQSRFDGGRAYVFPCDARGQVDMNRLSSRARNDYLFARRVIGREVLLPSVQVRGPGDAQNSRPSR